MKNTDEYIYCGIPTFMGSPYVTLADSSNYDVAVIGVPWDLGSSNRLGSKYAPRSIREYSMIDKIAVGDYIDLESKQKMRGSEVSICDLGDINVWPTSPEKNINEIQDIVKKIRKKSFPLILGGDHSITYANYKACIASLPNKNSKIGMIHFDAHLDLDDTFMSSSPDIWHGNVFRKLIDEGSLDGNRMITIGPRGRVAEEHLTYLKNKGIHLITSKEVKQKGVTSIMDTILKLFSKDTDFVFLTVDIDCLDISVSSGTGTPKYGGLDVSDLIQFLIEMKKLPIIGMDLVEVNPKFDPSGVTSILAGELLYNFLSFGFNTEIQKEFKDIVNK